MKTPLLDRIVLLLAVLWCMSLVPCAAAASDPCAENYAARVSLARRIARLQRQADTIWPQGGVCNATCQALEKRIGALLDEQLGLQAVGEALHCPLHPEGE